MARNWHPSVRFAALGVAAVFIAAAAPSVAAQIPGDNPRTEVFPVDDNRVVVAVESLNPEDGTVQVTVQNNTTGNITCSGVGGGPAATVTTAEIVARSVDFYTQYPQSQLADLTLNLPSQAGGAQQIALGSAQDQLGSASDFLNPEWAALSANKDALDAARLAGQYGVIGTSISLQAQQATNHTVRLEHPSAGTRADFQTGFFMTCAIGGNRSAFFAYEGDMKPSYGTDGSTGSLGSAGLGS